MEMGLSRSQLPGQENRIDRNIAYLRWRMGGGRHALAVVDIGTDASAPDASSSPELEFAALQVLAGATSGDDGLVQ